MLTLKAVYSISFYRYEQLPFTCLDRTEAPQRIKSILWMLVVTHMVNRAFMVPEEALSCSQHSHAT
jgi:hypothetical protein